MNLSLRRYLAAKARSLRTDQTLSLNVLGITTGRVNGGVCGVDEIPLRIRQATGQNRLLLRPYFRWFPPVPPKDANSDPQPLLHGIFSQLRTHKPCRGSSRPSFGSSGKCPLDSTGQESPNQYANKWENRRRETRGATGAHDVPVELRSRRCLCAASNDGWNHTVCLSRVGWPRLHREPQIFKIQFWRRGLVRYELPRASAVMWSGGRRLHVRTDKRQLTASLCEPSWRKPNASAHLSERRRLGLWEGKTQSDEIGDPVTMLELISLLRALAGLFRDRRDLVVENLLLRHQLQVALRSHPRPDLKTRDWFLWLLFRRLVPDWKQHLILVQPETVVRWHRQGWRLCWRWRSGHQLGRPRASRFGN
jgi:hypothetical protein